MWYKIINDFRSNFRFEGFRDLGWRYGLVGGIFDLCEFSFFEFMNFGLVLIIDRWMDGWIDRWIGR